MLELGPLVNLNDSDEPDASRAYTQAAERLCGSGAEYEAEKAQTKDLASGRPAEELTCARGRDTADDATAQDWGIPDSNVSIG